MSNVLDPIELLTNKGERESTYLHTIGIPICCAALGFGMGAFLNWGFRKPPFSGIQKHIGLAATGAILGQYFDNKRNNFMAKRDAVLRHYIELHPDDFPKIERKKFGDVLERWAPIR